MSKRTLNIILSSILLLLLAVLALTTKSPTQVLSVSPSIVISEIQIAGTADADEDFIELYNPTSSDLDLNGYRLVKRTASGATDSAIKAWNTETIIPAQGYYLWANDTWIPSVSPDASTSATLAINNGIALRQGPSNTGTIIDSVAWGTATNAFVESNPFPSNPPADQSIERKPGTSNPLAGNGTDTDNNANDFDLRTTSEPQNTSSSPEPELASPSPSPSEGPTPTPEPSVTPTPTPEPSVSPSPTLEPSPSPTVEPTPSASPEASPSPTPEVSPSPTPEVSPSPTIEPSTTPSPTPAASVSPTPEPSVSPSPTPTPSPQANIFFRGGLFTCGVRNTQFFFFNRLISIPQFRCWLY